MSNRQVIFEKLYEILYSDATTDEQKSSAELLISKFKKRIISELDVMNELENIDPSKSKLNFMLSLKSKAVFKNILDFSKGKLSESQKAKLVSSLITQALIYCETNNENISNFNIDELSNLLISYSKVEKIDSDKLNSIILNYGFIATEELKEEVK